MEALTRGPVLTGRENATNGVIQAHGQCSTIGEIASDAPLRHSPGTSTPRLSTRIAALCASPTTSGDGPANTETTGETRTKASHLIIVAERCPYCTLFVSPRDIIRHPGFSICVNCEARHNEAVDAIANGKGFTGQCAECGKSAQLCGAMAVHYEGGRYRVNCLDCDPGYVQKRRDLYGATQFGHSIGL